MISKFGDLSRRNDQSIDDIDSGKSPHIRVSAMRETEPRQKNDNMLDVIRDSETDIRESVASKASNVSY